MFAGEDMFESGVDQARELGVDIGVKIPRLPGLTELHDRVFFSSESSNSWLSPSFEVCRIAERRAPFPFWCCLTLYGHWRSYVRRVK